MRYIDHTNCKNRFSWLLCTGSDQGQKEVIPHCFCANPIWKLKGRTNRQKRPCRRNSARSFFRRWLCGGSRGAPSGCHTKIERFGIESAKKIGRELDKTVVAVGNKYSHREIIISKPAVQHSLDGANPSRLRTNARIGAICCDAVANAIPVNALNALFT